MTTTTTRRVESADTPAQFGQAVAQASAWLEEQERLLGEAIAWLNEQKRQLGDDLVFGIDDEGFLRAALFGFGID